MRNKDSLRKLRCGIPSHKLVNLTYLGFADTENYALMRKKAELEPISGNFIENICSRQTCFLYSYKAKVTSVCLKIHLYVHFELNLFFLVFTRLL